MPDDATTTLTADDPNAPPMPDEVADAPHSKPVTEPDNLPSALDSVTGWVEQRL